VITGVSSYSFSGAEKAGRIDFIDIPAKAKDMGFEVLEFSSLSVPDGEKPLDFAKRLRDACDHADITVANYTIKADFVNGVDVPPVQEPERLRSELEIAKALGSPGMRHDATWDFTGTFDQALPILAVGCLEVTKMAEDMGIKTMVENHGYFAQDSDRMEKLVAAVDHPNFGLLVDIGNFICVDEDPAKAVGRTASFASHVHVKDFHLKNGSLPDPGEGWNRSRAGNYWRGAILGHGEVPVGQCLSVLAKAGYDGVVSIEFEGMEPSEIGITIGLENLKRYIANL
jgi:sugar phosphate isomerase/epimerase